MSSPPILSHHRLFAALFALSVASCAQNPSRTEAPVASRGAAEAQEEARNQTPRRGPEVARLYEAALEHEDNGDYGEALESLEEALELDPSFGPAHFERGFLLESMGSPAEALVAYDRLMLLDPDYDDLHYNRGVCFTELGDWSRALESYDLAIAADPGFGWAHANRAETLLKLRRFEEAKAAAEAAIDLDESHTLAHQLLGVAHLNDGDPEAAYAAFSVCRSQEPKNASHLFNSGLALEDMQRFSEALQAYIEAGTVNPDHSSARAAARRLQEKMLEQAMIEAQDK